MQGVACIILSVGFYFIGLPLSYVLMFTFQLDIFGFWYGMIVAETLTNSFLFVLIWCFDWSSFSEKAMEHISFAVPLKNSRTDSLSSNKIDEPIELLPYTSDRKNNQTKINGDNTVEIPSTNGEVVSSEPISEKAISESIKIKVIILILFFGMFITSFIHSYQ